MKKHLISLAATLALASGWASAQGNGAEYVDLNQHPAISSIPSADCFADCTQVGLLGDKMVAVRRDASGTPSLHVVLDDHGEWAEPLVPVNVLSDAAGIPTLDDWFSKAVGMDACTDSCKGMVYFGGDTIAYRRTASGDLEVRLGPSEREQSREREAIRYEKSTSGTGAVNAPGVQHWPNCPVPSDTTVEKVTRETCDCSDLGMGMTWWFKTYWVEVYNVCSQTLVDSFMRTEQGISVGCPC